MIFISLCQSLLLIIFAYVFLFIYASLFFKIGNKLGYRSELENNYLIYPVVGFAVLAVLYKYLYFILNINLNSASYIILMISSISLFFIELKKISLEFLRLLIKVAPILIFFIIFLLLKGEQFYIFRGNYWDNMNYISQAILINDFSFKEILNIKSTHLNDYSYYQNGSGNITARPLTSLFLAVFLKIKILNFFFINYLFKIFLFSLVFLSFYFVISQIIQKNKYFFSLVFVFSFWILYVLEIEALSHLNSIPFFLVCTGLILRFKNDRIFKNDVDTYLFLLINISFFFFYPEFFSISVFIFIGYLILKFKFILFIKKNFLILIFLFFLFLIFTLPAFFTIYYHLYDVVRFATNSDVNFWGYYSLFFLGKDISFLTEQNISIIKNLFQENKSFFTLYDEVIKILLENRSYLFFLNFIPAFSGLYYLTISRINDVSDFVTIFVVITVNLYLIKIIFFNIKNIFCYSSNLTYLLRSYVLFFIFFSIIFLLNRNYWTLTKLYIYFGPILFIFFSINNFKNTSFLQINYVYIFLILIFPFYKFILNNNGIGVYDSFPSIINPKYKKNIDWILNEQDLSHCNQIKVNMNDPIINGYISIKIRYFGYSHFAPFIYKKYTNNTLSNKKNNCYLILKNSKFLLQNEYKK